MEDKHPWHMFYWDSDTDSTSIHDYNMEMLMKFRNETIKWKSGNSIRKISNEQCATNNTSLEIPKTPFSLYAVYKKFGSTLVLTPIHREVAIPKRLDLRFIRLTEFSTDTLNPGRINIQQFHTGAIICVLKLQPKPKVKLDDFNKFDLENCGEQMFWDVAEFFTLPVDIKKDVSIITHAITKSGNFLCASDTIFNEVQLSRKIAPANTKLNFLFLADVFVPNIKPDDFMKSLKNENRRQVELLCQEVLPISNFLPTAIRVSPAQKSMFEMIEKYKSAFAFCQNEQTARNILWKIVCFADNALRTIADSQLDECSYSTKIETWTVKDDECVFDFKIRGQNVFEKWDRKKINLLVRIGLGSDFFHCDVISTTPITNIENLVRARTVLRNISYLENNTDFIVVNQRGEMKLRLENATRIPTNTNADRIIQSIYGGSGTNSENLEYAQISDSRMRYIEMVCDSSIPAVIGSASFGCGKSVSIARAALSLSARDGRNMSVLAAVTNSGAIVLVQKLVETNPNLENEVVRLVSDWNIEQLGPEFRTKFDFSVQFEKLIFEIIKNRQDGQIESIANGEIVWRIRSLKTLLLNIPTDSTMVRELLKNGFNIYEIFRFYFSVRSPKIIVGTVDTILKYFSKNLLEWTDHVISVQLDEASMISRATFLNILATFPCSRFALVGDHRQLAPFTKNDVPSILRNISMGSCLTDALESQTVPIVSFNTIYRCRSEVTEILGDLFYDSQLVTSPRQPHRKPFENQYPLIFVDTRSTQTVAGRSFQNQEEAEMAKSLAKQLLNHYPSEEIGIVCFYKAQVELLEKWGKENRVFIGTVDSTQGREFQVSIICTTRSTPFKWCRFMMDPRRVNVAFSRSCNLNYILGNKKCMGDVKFWRTFVEKCQENDTFFDCDFLDVLISNNND